MNEYNTTIQDNDSKEELTGVKHSANVVGFMSIVATFVFFSTSLGFSYILKLLIQNSNSLQGAGSLINNIYSGLINLIGIGITGMLFIFIKKDRTASQLPFDKVKKSTLFPLLCIGFSVCMVSNLLTSIFIETTQNFGFDFSFSAHESRSSTYIEILVYFISVAVVPAVSEEILFRGAILSTLRKYSDGVAVFVSALLFGLFHANLVQIPFAFIVGLVLGWTVVYTNSMLPAILIHFINNSYSVISNILSTNTELWEMDSALTLIGSTLFVVGVAVFAFISAMKLSRKDKNFLSLNKYEGNLTSSVICKTVFKSPLIIGAILLLCIETALNYIL